MSTTCCACLASRAPRISPGFIVAPYNVERTLLSAAFDLSCSANKQINTNGDGQECPSYDLSLHDDVCGHLGMDGAEVGVRSGRRERVTELLVSVERVWLEGRLVFADYGVRDVVLIRPGHLCAG